MASLQSSVFRLSLSVHFFRYQFLVSEQMAGRGRAGRGRGGRRSQNDEFLGRDFEIEELKRQVQELQERLDQRNIHDTRMKLPVMEMKTEILSTKFQVKILVKRIILHRVFEEIGIANKILTSGSTFQSLRDVHNLMSSLIGFIL